MGNEAEKIGSEPDHLQLSGPLRTRRDASVVVPSGTGPAGEIHLDRQQIKRISYYWLARPLNIKLCLCLWKQ